MIGTDRQNSAAISRPVSACFDTRCLLQSEQRTSVDESGMIRNQLGNKIDQKMVAVHRTLCTIPIQFNVGLMSKQVAETKIK
jgi:hypothetical protein